MIPKFTRSRLCFALIPFITLGFSTTCIIAAEKPPLPAYKIETGNVSCGSSGPSTDWLGRYDGAWKTSPRPVESIIIVTKVEEAFFGCGAKIIAAFGKNSKSGASYIHTVGEIANGRMRFKTKNGTITGFFRKKKGRLDKTRLIMDHSGGSRMIGVRQ